MSTKITHRTPTSQPNHRYLMMFIIVTVALFSIVALFYLLNNASQFESNTLTANPTISPANRVAMPASDVTAPDSSASELPTANRGEMPDSVVARSAAAPDGAQPFATTEDTAQNVVAIVDGVSLDIERITVMALADRAMNALAQTPPTVASAVASAVASTVAPAAAPAVASTEALLERLVNEELVWQAATAAGFAIPLAEIDQLLAQLLAAHGAEMADLQSALDDVDLSLVRFMHYFERIVVVDRFATEQASTSGVALADYVTALQSSAKISFGASVAHIDELLSPADLPMAAQSDAQTEGDTQTEGETQAGEVSAYLVEDSAIVSLDTQSLIAPAPDTQAAPQQSGPFDLLDSAAANMSVGEPTEIADETVVRGVQNGQYAPLFQLPILGADNQSSMALEDLSGAPAVLSFWTTWCPYCRRQTPVLTDAFARVAEQGIQFVGINVQEAPDSVQSYVDSMGIAYPVVLDEQGSVAGQYQIRGFPTTYFIDADGQIVARHIGALTADILDSYLLRLLTPDDS